MSHVRMSIILPVLLVSGLVSAAPHVASAPAVEEGLFSCQGPNGNRIFQDTNQGLNCKRIKEDGGSNSSVSYISRASTPSEASAPGATPVAQIEYSITSKTTYSGIKGSAQPFADVPDLAACQSGQLASSELQYVVDALNSIRRLHDLPPVRLDQMGERRIAPLALDYAINDLARTTYAGSANARLCATSLNDNIRKQVIKETIGIRKTARAGDVPLTAASIEHWLIDDAGGSDLRARQILLNPFLTAISFSRVDGFEASARVLLPQTGSRGGWSGKAPAYVAYPMGNYPAHLFNRNGLLTFAVIADPNEARLNSGSEVRFDDAMVSMTDEQNRRIPILRQYAQHDSPGLGNGLHWKADGLQLNHLYKVSIDRVQVNGQLRHYAYTFQLQP